MSASVTVIDTYANTLATLDPIDSSSVTFDRGQAKRRSADLTFEDPTGSLVPQSITDLLAPSHLSGHFLKVIADGVCLGTYAINATETHDSGDDRAVRATGYDRSWLIDRSPLASAYGVTAGTSWPLAIQALLDSILPGLSYAAFANLAYLAPAVMLSAGTNAWNEASGNWAPAIGAELHWSLGGANALLDDGPILVPVADPRTAEQVWAYAEGPGGTLTAVTTTMVGDLSGATLSPSVSSSGGGVPNYFIRDGQLGPAVSATTAPVTASAFDDSPSSPTWIGGAYGRVVDYKQDPLITAATQAQAAADAALFLTVGAVRPFSLQVVPNAASRTLDVGQVGTIARALAGLSGAVGVIDSVKHSLGPSSPSEIAGRQVA